MRRECVAVRLRCVSLVCLLSIVGCTYAAAEGLVAINEDEPFCGSETQKLATEFSSALDTQSSYYVSIYRRAASFEALSSTILGNGIFAKADEIDELYEPRNWLAHMPFVATTMSEFEALLSGVDSHSSVSKTEKGSTIFRYNFRAFGGFNLLLSTSPAYVPDDLKEMDLIAGAFGDSAHTEGSASIAGPNQLGQLLGVDTLGVRDIDDIELPPSYFTVTNLISFDAANPLARRVAHASIVGFEPLEVIVEVQNGSHADHALAVYIAESLLRKCSEYAFDRDMHKIELLKSAGVTIGEIDSDTWKQEVIALFDSAANEAGRHVSQKALFGQFAQEIKDIQSAGGNSNWIQSLIDSLF